MTLPGPRRGTSRILVRQRAHVERGLRFGGNHVDAVAAGHDVRRHRRPQHRRMTRLRSPRDSRPPRRRPSRQGQSARDSAQLLRATRRRRGDRNTRASCRSSTTGAPFAERADGAGEVGDRVRLQRHRSVPGDGPRAISSIALGIFSSVCTPAANDLPADASWRCRLRRGDTRRRSPEVLADHELDADAASLPSLAGLGRKITSRSSAATFLALQASASVSQAVDGCPCRRPRRARSA